MRHHIGKYPNDDLNFVLKLIENFYVDDLASGTRNVDEARSRYILEMRHLKENTNIKQDKEMSRKQDSLKLDPVA